MSDNEGTKPEAGTELAGRLEPPVGQNQYRCEECEGIFDKDWTDEEAKAEQEANGFGDIPEAHMAVVCDDCYRSIMGLPPNA